MTLEIDDVTVLISENNCGKTSLLEALQIAMTKGLSRRAAPFSEFDFHLTAGDSTPESAPPILLTAVFEEGNVDEWPDEVDQQLAGAVQILGDERKRVTFQVGCRFDQDTNDYAVEWSFLDQAGNLLVGARQLKLVADLQTLCPVFLLTAVREASQHFHSRSAYWSPFTKSPQIQDDQRKELEEQIEQINQSVLDSHEPFSRVREHLAEAGKLIALDVAEPVRMEAFPSSIFDVLTKTQVKLGTPSGYQLPVQQHGAGTQSLSVLYLFAAFLESRLASSYSPLSNPVLALEEPETHLHPSAVRTLWPTVSKFTGQKIVTTHSGDLLAAVPLTAIRRLSRRNGAIEIFRIGATTLDDNEYRKLTYHVRAKRGALFFSRCWLLVEGETDFTILPEIADAIGNNFDSLGISCVEYAQCSLPPLIKTAKDLGIEWHVLADGDPSGQKYANKAGEFLNGDSNADRITVLSRKDIEHLCWHTGMQDIAGHLSLQK